MKASVSKSFTDDEFSIALARFAAEQDAAIAKGDCPSRRYIPTAEPYLSQWCRLDTLHQVALRALEAGRPVEEWRAAPCLADAKYRVWLESVGAR